MSIDRLARDLLHKQITNFPSFSPREHAARLRELERTSLRPFVSSVCRVMRLHLCGMRRCKIRL